MKKDAKLNKVEVSNGITTVYIEKDNMAATPDEFSLAFRNKKAAGRMVITITDDTIDLLEFAIKQYKKTNR